MFYCRFLVRSCLPLCLIDGYFIPMFYILPDALYLGLTLGGFYLPYTYNLCYINICISRLITNCRWNVYLRFIASADQFFHQLSKVEMSKSDVDLQPWYPFSGQLLVRAKHCSKSVLCEQRVKRSERQPRVGQITTSEATSLTIRMLTASIVVDTLGSKESVWSVLT